MPWRPPALVSPRAHSSLHHASDVVREPHIKVNSFFRWYVHLLLLSHQHEVVGEIFFFFLIPKLAYLIHVPALAYMVLLGLCLLPEVAR